MEEVTLESIIKELDNLTEEELHQNHLQFKHLPSLVQVPWNNPELVERRRQFELSYGSALGAQVPDENSSIFPRVYNANQWINFIEYELNEIYGDVKVYDEQDGGALTSLLDFARGFLSTIEA